MVDLTSKLTDIFSNKNIILGVTGGVAAYKAAELSRILIKNKANVQVVMTRGAAKFITELTFQALTGRAARNSLFDPNAELGMGHIELAKWADLIIIAPATANFIAKLAHGFADDLLSTICLVHPKDKKIYIAPAMNSNMWQNKFVQNNINLLEQNNYCILGTEYGEQACGDFGYGRMLAPDEIINKIFNNFDNHNTIKNSKKILITAGPTIEAIDPVRYISNHSSGKMGYSLAIAANKLGYNVTLISGPVDSALINMLNNNIKLIGVTTADSMLAAVQDNIDEQDVFISVAAVADYKYNNVSANKIKKKQDNFNLGLIRTPDILKHVSEFKSKHNKKLLLIGFAAETEDHLNNAMNKLLNKNLDLIILNQVDNKEIGFNNDYNAVKVLDKDNNIHVFERQLKPELAAALMDLISNYINKF